MTTILDFQAHHAAPADASSTTSDESDGSCTVIARSASAYPTMKTVNHRMDLVEAAIIILFNLEAICLGVMVAMMVYLYKLQLSM